MEAGAPIGAPYGFSANGRALERLVVFADRRFRADHRIDIGKDRAQFVFALGAFANHHQIGGV